MDIAEITIGFPGDRRVVESAGAGGTATPGLIRRARPVESSRQPVGGIPVVVDAPGIFVAIEKIGIAPTTRLRLEQGNAIHLKGQRRASRGATDSAGLLAGSNAARGTAQYGDAAKVVRRQDTQYGLHSCRDGGRLIESWGAAQTVRSIAIRAEVVHVSAESVVKHSVGGADVLIQRESRCRLRNVRQEAAVEEVSRGGRGYAAAHAQVRLMHGVPPLGRFQGDRVRRADGFEATS